MYLFRVDSMTDMEIVVCGKTYTHFFSRFYLSSVADQTSGREGDAATEKIHLDE